MTPFPFRINKLGTPPSKHPRKEKEPTDDKSVIVEEDRSQLSTALAVYRRKRPQECSDE